MTRKDRSVAFAAALAAGLFATGTLAAASKSEQAASHYKSASQLYDDLQRVPEPELGFQQFELVISAMEAVQRTDPSSEHCDDALVAIGGLYRSMAERFGEDKYRLKAIETYEFVAREYPRSQHRDSALEMAAQIRARLPAQPAALAATGRPSGPAEAALSDGIHAAGTTVHPSRGSAPLTVFRLRHQSYADGTRIVLDVQGGRGALKYDRLQGPARLYIDLFDSYLSSNLSKNLLHGVGKRIDDGLIANARLAQNRRNKARLVLDLVRPVSFDAFWLDNPARLVLDLRASGTPRLARTREALTSTPTEVASAPATTQAPRAADATADGSMTNIRALALKAGRIVVDAGHGGHDTGSVGPRGLREKDVVLDIATRLGTLLEEQLGAEVIQTRSSDVFVELKERARIANERDADLMVSIHCNSAPASHVRGIETYYLSLTTEPWALSVAAQENATSSYTISEHKSLIERIDRHQKKEESKEFAQRIQSSLHRGLSRHSSRIRDRGIRKGPFTVLMETRVPAALVEVGFLSNRDDEALLQQLSFRQEVAEHLFAGIQEYIRSLGTPRMRTALAAGSEERE